MAKLTDKAIAWLTLPPKRPRLEVLGKVFEDLLAPCFADAESATLIAAIEHCRAIDPAVGPGAFPSGLLRKPVHVPSRADPGGVRWKAANRQPFLVAIENAKRIDTTHRTFRPAARRA